MSATSVLGYPSNPSIPHTSQFQFHYSSSQASSASSSSISSFFSTDANSFQSAASSVSSSFGYAHLESGCAAGVMTAGAGAIKNQHTQNTGHCKAKPVEVPLPVECRQNPRRTCNTVANGTTSGVAYAQRPPMLVRQCERKDSFVDGLVDSASQIIETIWPLSVTCLKSDAAGSKAVFPLRMFIQETLRRSRTSYSTLQVALYYLILIKNCVPKVDFTMEQPVQFARPRAMQCGRRMFLAALILASKYLQDRNYSARAWSKISGLSTAEINQNEWAFLEAVDWKLHVPEPVFQRWSDIVWKCTPKPGDFLHGEGLRWSAIIPHLSPELDIDLSSQEHSSPLRGTLVPASKPVSSRTLSLPMHPSRPEIASGQAPAFTRDVLSASAPEQSVMGHSRPTLPPLPALGLLPTPQITPHLNNLYTPAASVDGLGHVRHSISRAMSQVQSMSVQSAAVDRRRSMGYGKQTNCSSGIRRQSSLVRSTSLSSSPESMISDVFSQSSSRSSRSSRSSSISSVASGTCAPVRPRLVRQATHQSTRSQPNCLKASKKSLSIGSPISEVDFLGGLCMSPDSFSTGSNEAAHVLCELSASEQRSRPPLARAVSSSSSMSTCSESSQLSRKRGRTDSLDNNLQWTVRRDLLSAIFSGHVKEDGSNSVLPDARVANSFWTQTPATLRPRQHQP